jgi:hypothetical protein
MTMSMTGSNGLLSVPTEHLPGLVVLVVISPVVWILISGCRSLAAGGVGWATGGPLAPDPPARSEITAAGAVAPVSPAKAVA